MRGGHKLFVSDLSPDTVRQLAGEGAGSRRAFGMTANNGVFVAQGLVRLWPALAG